MASCDEELKRFEADLPLSRASAIPSTWYTRDDIYLLEQTHVLQSTWQYVTRLELLKEPGSFVTHDIGNEPILITRDKEGKLNAFSNVCRHRAARIVTQKSGKSSFFQCRYHGWTYDVCGKLKGTPEFQGVDNFIKEANCLPQFKVETWGALIFVHLGKPEKSLMETLFPLQTRTKSIPWIHWPLVSRKEYELKCNWKLFIDNYLDGGYHINTLHPSLAGLIDYSTYRTEIAGETSVQISPLKSDPDDKALSKVRSGEAAYYWWVYPNLMLNIYDGFMDLNLVLPLAVDRTKVIFEFYFANPNDLGIPKSIEVADQIQQEDIDICEEVQRNLRSQFYDRGRFSASREAGGFHFHQLLSAALRNKNSEENKLW
jgi:choline monooxygenase